MKKYAILPILAGFFVMGFSDIIGAVMKKLKLEYALSGEMAGFLGLMIFIWFFLVSVPTGVACGKWGRRNMTLVSLAVTAAAMFLALAANAERVWIYFLVFALLGIGNTVIQAALPALLSNVVPQDQLTSRISLGQFVKAVCGILTPIFVAALSKKWGLLFPIYGCVTLLCALWLFFADIPDERANKVQGAAQPSFLGSLRLLGDGYVLAMVGGIFFSVAADVGFNVAIPDFLANIYKMGDNESVLGCTVYFVAKMVGVFIGAAIFAKMSPARCFPWSVALALAGTVGIFFAPSWVVFLVCVSVASLGIANTFGMCMGLAINRRPDKTNEVSALAVMAISGGGVGALVIGFVQKRAGESGCVWVFLACLAYLFALGLFSAGSARGLRKDA